MYDNRILNQCIYRCTGSTVPIANALIDLSISSIRLSTVLENGFKLNGPLLDVTFNNDLSNLRILNIKVSTNI
jgi:hypothetical protein